MRFLNPKTCFKPSMKWNQYFLSLLLRETYFSWTDKTKRIRNKKQNDNFPLTIPGAVVSKLDDDSPWVLCVPQPSFVSKVLKEV